MARSDCEHALNLLDKGDVQAASAFIEHAMREAPDDAGLLYASGRLLFMTERYAEASKALEAASKADPSDVDVAYAWAMAARAMGTLKGLALARDILLDVAEKHPVDARVIRAAAESCSGIGPLEKAVELWQRAAEGSDDADVHFGLSDTLAALGRRREAVEALRAAAKFDPERYGKALAEVDIDKNGSRSNSSRPSVKRARYPDQEAIQKNFKSAIAQYVLTEFDAPRFITSSTSFFTMGSCFAWNITRALSGMGYCATCMPMSEHINTTFANRYFVDWLEDSIADPELADRIADMLPPGFSKESVVEKIKEADVFILTLGVGAAFFDRESGAFIMPRASALNLRTLAEKYEFRTTTVGQNVENVSYIIEYVRKVNPDIKVFITVSPVPMQMTFEFDSAIIADCVSKSTMRVVAHEIVQRYKSTGQLYYFPSFEVFRWLGSHAAEPVYGADDGAAWHVSEDIVEMVVQSFIEMLADREGAQPQPAVTETPGITMSPLFSPDMIDRTKPTYFYGSGQMGQGLLSAMGDRGSWNFQGFIDTRRPGLCRGYPVFDLTQFQSKLQAGDQVVVTSGSVAEITRALAGLGIAEAKDANPWWKARAFPAARVTA